MRSVAIWGAPKEVFDVKVKPNKIQQSGGIKRHNKQWFVGIKQDTKIACGHIPVATGLRETHHYGNRNSDSTAT